MKLFILTYLKLLIIVLIYGCNNQGTKHKTHIPKAIYDLDSSGYCSTLRMHAYERLNEGIIELVANYPTTINNDIKKVELFNKELGKRYGMQVLEIYDSFFYNQCIMPIMDSVIISNYGQNGKKRIIEELTNYIDSVYSQRSR